MIEQANIGLAVGGLWFTWFLFYIIDWFAQWLMGQGV